MVRGEVGEYCTGHRSFSATIIYIESPYVIPVKAKRNMSSLLLQFGEGRGFLEFGRLHIYQQGKLPL